MKNTSQVNSCLGVGSQSDESSLSSDECTPSLLHTGCTVVWSNAVYRSELQGGSSSSSDEHGMLKGDVPSVSWTGRSTLGGTSSYTKIHPPEVSSKSTTELIRVESASGDLLRTPGTAGSLDEFLGSMNSTKKVLAKLPAFREKCSVLEGEHEQESSYNREAYRVIYEREASCSPGVVTSIAREGGETEPDEETWVHGPERNLENELSAATRMAELEDEADSRLEAQLQRDIAALSQKLKKIHAQREQKAGAQSDPSSKVQRFFKTQAQKQPAVKTPDSNKVRSKVSMSKHCKEAEKTHLDRAAFEDQLKTLRLSPHFWGKNFDWAKSLRSGAQPAKVPRKETTMSSRNILLEKNRECKPQVADRLKQNDKKTRLKENVNRNLKEPPMNRNLKEPSTQAGARKMTSSVLPPPKPVNPSANGVTKKPEARSKLHGRVVASRAFANVPKVEKPSRS